jgi:DNA-binding NarL/FixJ family response regulator
MTKSSCVLLADRHHGLRDSVRGLLEAEFETVFMVADEASLVQGAGRLRPAMVVIDLSLSGGNIRGLLARVAEAPEGRMHKLEVHQAAREVGLDPAALAQLYKGDPQLLVTEQQDRVITDAGRARMNR